MHRVFRERAEARFAVDDEFEAGLINDRLNTALNSPSAGFIGSSITKSMLESAIVETDAELLDTVKPNLRPFGFETAKKAERWAQYRNAYGQDTGQEIANSKDMQELIARFKFDTALRQGDPYFVKLFSTLDDIRTNFEKHGETVKDAQELERKLIINSLLNGMDDLVDYFGAPILPNRHQEFVRIGETGYDDEGKFFMGNFIADRFKDPKYIRYYIDQFKPGLQYGKGGSFSLTVIETKSGFITSSHIENGQGVRLEAIVAYQALEAIKKQNPLFEPHFSREPFKPRIS